MLGPGAYYFWLIEAKHICASGDRYMYRCEFVI